MGPRIGTAPGPGLVHGTWYGTVRTWYARGNHQVQVTSVGARGNHQVLVDKFVYSHLAC